jgi:sirohydrochlorin cobaltochelatase
MRLAPVIESGAVPAGGGAAGAAVLLVGHGSTRSPHPDQLLQRHAAALRADDTFADVRATTLADPEGLQATLAGIRCREVFVVPMLMCDGLLYTEVLPDALGLGAGGAPAGTGYRDAYGHRIHLCPPIGLDPRVAALVVDRVRAGLRRAGVREAEATLVLIGHGSSRNQASERAVALQAARIRRQAAFARIEPAFLAQAPSLADVLRTLPRPLAGFALFTARGNHVIEDVETVFAAHAAPDVQFCGTLGEDDGMRALILAMLSDRDALRL